MNSTDTRVAQLTELAEMVDQATACEMADHEGDEPAKWIMWLSPCVCEDKPPYLLVCTPCKDARLTGGTIGCRGCGTVWVPGSTAYLAIIPL